MDIQKNTQVGAVVAQDYRAASVFSKAGIDFCCGGNRTIEEACLEHQLDSDEIVGLLRDSLSAPRTASGEDFYAWPIDLLADYIEKKHHRYVRAQLPLLQGMLEKIVRVHGKGHPELFEVQNEFEHCAEELTQHMKKEEVVLFPYVRRLVEASEAGRSVAAPFTTVQQPIAVMLGEHSTEGERFQRIRKLAKEYVVPEDACSTFKAAYRNLEAFERDLHHHIHLENNLLFPRAIELERSFME